MGGQGSGRWRTTTRCAIDDVITLDMRVLRGLGFVRWGKCTTGTIDWHAGGQDLGHAVVTLDLTDLSRCRLSVAYDTLDGLGDECVEISPQACRFGGFRAYFVCPERGRLCDVLAMVDGRLASRRAHTLTYLSQSLTRFDRTRRRAAQLEARLETARDHHLEGRKLARLETRWLRAHRMAREAYGDELRRQLGLS